MIKPTTKYCYYCGSAIIEAHPATKFCSEECHTKFKNMDINEQSVRSDKRLRDGACQRCGKEFVYLSFGGPHRRYCDECQGKTGIPTKKSEKKVRFTMQEVLNHAGSYHVSYGIMMNWAIEHGRFPEAGESLI